MNKADRAYYSDVATLGCTLCDLLGLGETPCHCHHPRTGVGAGRKSENSEVIGLCPEHHQGATGIHGLGRKAFEARYGVTEAELTAIQKQRVAGLRQRRSGCLA